jgi:hypothetical protein
VSYFPGVTHPHMGAPHHHHLILSIFSTPQPIVVSMPLADLLIDVWTDVYRSSYRRHVIITKCAERPNICQCMESSITFMSSCQLHLATLISQKILRDNGVVARYIDYDQVAVLCGVLPLLPWGLMTSVWL